MENEIEKESFLSSSLDLRFAEMKKNRKSEKKMKWKVNKRVHHKCMDFPFFAV